MASSDSSAQRPSLSSATEAVWMLTALGLLLDNRDSETVELRVQELSPIEEAALHVVVAAGWFAKSGDEFVPAGSISEALKRLGKDQLDAHIISTLQQAAVSHSLSIDERQRTGEWVHTDTRILQAQGLRSRRMVDIFVESVLPGFPKAQSRFESGQAHFLDVGAGAGHIAIAMCERFPGTTCLAVEPLASARQVARRNLETAGIDTVELVDGRVEDLDVTGKFDFAWMPLDFLALPELRAGLGTVLRSLREDGGLFGAAPANDDSLGASCAKFRSHSWGGSGVDAGRAREELLAAGYEGLRAHTQMRSVTVLSASRR